MEEIWKDVKGYEELYQVSNYGQIRSVDGTVGYRYKGKQRIYKGRMLKQVVRNGYLSVSLSKENKLKQKNIHRLVAEAFLPNPFNLPCLN
ncbi:MAG: NUMOD4 domain-containing protein [Phocaeicola vulgatus]